MSFSVGSAAIARGFQLPSNITYVSKTPCTGSGTADTVNYYSHGFSYTSLYIGIFTDNGSNSLTNRDFVSLGKMVPSLKQVTGLSLDCVLGDYIGSFCVDNQLHYWEGTGNYDLWYAAANYCDGGTHNFTFSGGGTIIISLNATGTETAAGGGDKIISMGFIGDNPKISNIKVLRVLGGHDG